MCVLIEKNIMHMHCNTSKYRIEMVDHVKIFKVYDELQYVNCNSTHTKIFVTVLRKKTPNCTSMWIWTPFEYFWMCIFYESDNNCWIFKLSLHFCMRAEYGLWNGLFDLLNHTCKMSDNLSVRFDKFVQYNSCTCICICVNFIFDDNCWNCW